MILAANSGLFAKGAACGTRYRVTCMGRTNNGVLQPCTGNSIDVTVVNLCPGCASNQGYISPEAFVVIANRDAERINIEYNRIGFNEICIQDGNNRHTLYVLW
ncbi:EG45-like domain containing protein [Tanacetum coccineum]